MLKRLASIAFVVAAVLVLALPLRPYSRLAGLAILALVALLDYRAFAARTNASAVWAWAVTRCLEATRQSLDTAALDTSKLERLDSDRRSFLDPDQLSVRPGDRPKMVRGVPHRQLDQHPTPDLRSLMRHRLSTLEDFKELGSHTLTFRQSLWELTGAEALIVQGCTVSRCSAQLMRAKGEFAHLHSHDGSMHAMLSPCDVITVIHKGWGELFAVAGALGGRVPFIVLVYAPRTKEECETVIKISQAACRYALTPSPPQELS